MKVSVKLCCTWLQTGTPKCARGEGQLAFDDHGNTAARQRAMCFLCFFFSFSWVSIVDVLMEHQSVDVPLEAFVQVI